MSKNSNKSTKAKEPEGTPATPQVEVKRHWRKPNPLNVKGLDKNKSYRWVDKKKLQQKKYEGYETVDPKSVNYTAPDTEGYEGAPQYRELVLCEMPKSMAEERNEHYREKSEKALASAKTKFYKEARRAGVEAYEGEPRRKNKTYHFT